MRIAKLDRDGSLTVENRLYEYPRELRGTRNIFSNSLMNKDFSRWVGCKVKTTTFSVRAECTNQGRSFGIIQSHESRNMTIKEDETYVLSFLAKGNVNSLSYNYFMRSDGPNLEIDGYNKPLKDNWQRISINVKTPIDWSTNTGYILIGTRDVAEGKYFEVRNMKLERGEVTSTWTPNPIDLELSYPDSIEKFYTGFNKEGLLSQEIVEFPPEIEGSLNMISSKCIDNRGLKEMDFSNFNDGGSITIETVGGYSGLRIDARSLKPNSKYTMSFKYRKLTGTIEEVGGHTDPTWRNNVTYYDGVESGPFIKSRADIVTDDKSEHRVVVMIETSNVIESSDYIYIQFNRGKFISAKVEVYEWKLERGESPSWWTPSPLDLNMNYPEWVKNFKPSISDKGVLTKKLIEGVQGPGGTEILQGNSNYGYYGVVSSDELFSGYELQKLTGLPGEPLFNNIEWLKFSLNKRQVYVPKKPILKNVSWQEIDDAGCVNGEKIIEKKGVKYRVMLLSGNTPSIEDSEWNRLLLPTSIMAKHQNWSLPDNIRYPTDYWETDFTNEDLYVQPDHGGRVWVREPGFYRGRYSIEFGEYFRLHPGNRNFGWLPMLEVVEGG